jgi:TonB family protein
VVAIALAVSALLHALLIAWPRWPTWHDEFAGVYDGTAEPIKARVAGAGRSSSDASSSSGSQMREAAIEHEGAAPGLAESDSRAAARAGVVRPAAPPRGRSERLRATAERNDRSSKVPSPAGGRSWQTADQPAAAAPAAIGGTAPIAPGSTPSIAPQAAGAVRAAPAPTQVDRSDIASIAQYRIALISVSRRFKPPAGAVPPDAADGRVDVQLAIAADGALADVRVLRSSGHSALDVLAVEMLRNAKAQAPVPPRLLDRAFELDVPVVFTAGQAVR